MNITSAQNLAKIPLRLFQNLRSRTPAMYLGIILTALIAFEVFNFSSTDFALRNMVGSQSSGFMNWSTLLALAFCGMDFAGIARLLGCPSEAQGRGGWYLLGAWALAAAMNAGLTWWGISLAVYNQPVEYALFIDPMTFVTVIPLLVAAMVWVIRVLIIGALVASFDQTVLPQSAARKSGSAARFGFKPNQGTAPAGYQPIQRAAKAHRENF